MRPASLFRSSGRNACVVSISPKTFVSNVSRHAPDAFVRSPSSPFSCFITPALLTRMSSRPKSRSTVSAARLMLSDLLTSSSMECASMPSLRSPAAAASPFLASRAPSSTVMPCVPELTGGFESDAFIGSGD